MKLLSFEELPEKGVPYSRSWIYRLVERDEFPRPVKLGGRKVAFVEREIDAWIRSKIEERNAAIEAEAEARVASKAEERDAA